VLVLKDLTDEIFVKLCLLCVILIPYVLPQMHDRYFFLADVVSVIAVFAVRSRKYLYVSAAMILVSFMSYWWFLFGRDPLIPYPWMTLGMLAMLCVLVDDIFIRPMNERGESPPARSKLKPVITRRS